MPTKTLSCTRNVSISSKYPQNSYTESNRLAFGRGSANDEYRLLLAFPALGIEAGSIINSATLTVPKREGAIGSNAGFTATARRITENWGTNANWANLPGNTTTGSADAHTGTGHSGNVSFNVKAIVQAWMDGSGYYGFMLCKEASGGIYLKCAVNHGATLTVNYTEPTSDFTLSASSVAAGNSFTVHIDRASSALTHKVVFKFGDYTITKTDVGTSTTIDTTLAMLNAIPRATSGTAKVTVTTYSGSKAVGSAVAKSIKVTAPASVKPTLSTLSVTRIDGEVPASWGVYVQGKSKAQLTISGAAGAYGSTIAARTISGGGQKGTTSPWTTDFITKTGRYTFSATVTDSRGRTSAAVESSEIAVYAHGKPTISGAAANRCDADGTSNPDGRYLRAKLSASTSYGCNGHNVIAATKVEYRKNGASTWSPGATNPDSGAYVVFGDNNILEDSAYQVRFSATDSLGSTATKTVTVASALRIISVRPGGKGVAFGRMAGTDNVLESAWPIMYNGTNVALEGHSHQKINRDDGQGWGVGPSGHLIPMQDGDYKAGGELGTAAYTLNRIWDIYFVRGGSLNKGFGVYNDGSLVPCDATGWADTGPELGKSSYQFNRLWSIYFVRGGDVNKGVGIHPDGALAPCNASTWAGGLDLGTSNWRYNTLYLTNTVQADRLKTADATSASNAIIDANGTVRRTSGSSRRFKRDIADLPLAAAEQALELRPVRFEFRLDAPGIERNGFIAEETLDVAPQYVDRSTWEAGEVLEAGTVIEEGTIFASGKVLEQSIMLGEDVVLDGPMVRCDNVRYGEITAALVRVMQDWRGRIAALEELAAQQAREITALAQTAAQQATALADAEVRLAALERALGFDEKP